MSTTPPIVRMSKEEREKCRLVTPKFRVSYPHLFKPQQPMGGVGKPKYSVTMLFPKDRELIGTRRDGKPRSLKAAIKNAKIAAYGADETKWPKKLESPISDGDDAERYEGKEGYKGHWVVKASASEDQRPAVIDRDQKIIENAADLYPGCYARAFITAFPWKFGEKKQGIGFSLEHVQKWSDGKPFSSKTPVEQVLGVIEDEDTDETESEDDEIEF